MKLLLEACRAVVVVLAMCFVLHAR